MTKVSTTENSKKTIKCLKCLKDQACNSSNFYININPLFTSDRLEVCKKCINSLIGEDKNNPNYLNNVRLVLGLMNKPFLNELWMSSEEDWTKYVTRISSLPQYKDMTMVDSDYFQDVHSNVYSGEEDFITTDELTVLQQQWGKTLNADDYLFLEKEFEALMNSYECDSYAQEMLFQEIAQHRLVIKKNREANKPTDKEMKTLQDLLGSSNIKPVQETGANAAEQATFGTLIKKWENERPVPEPDPEWQDVDGIKKYISVWFLGHLCRMLGINNDYSKMYDEEVAKYTVEEPQYEQDEDGASI